MILRAITKLDYDIISKLNNMQDFKLEHIGNCIIDRIAEEDGTAVAYGIVKNMGEAIILTDPSAPLITRAKAMRELMLYAEYGARKVGLDQLHCFVRNDKLARTLIKHYGFIPTNDIVLVKNL